MASKMENKLLEASRKRNAESQEIPADNSNFADKLLNAIPVTEERQRISCAQIRPSPYQPRREFDVTSLLELANGIREVGGLIHPIVVRKVGDHYELLAGERRLRTHVDILKWDFIDAEVRQCDDRLAAKIALIENLGREELSDYEKSCSLPVLQEVKAAKTDVDLARILKCSDSLIRMLWVFQTLPEPILDILNKHPRVLTSAFVTDIKKHCDQGKTKLCVQALTLAAEGKFKNKSILAYIDNNSTARHQPDKREIRDAKNNLCARLVSANGKITISLHGNFKTLAPDALNNVEKALQELT